MCVSRKKCVSLKLVFRVKSVIPVKTVQSAFPLKSLFHLGHRPIINVFLKIYTCIIITFKHTLQTMQQITENIPNLPHHPHFITPPHTHLTHPSTLRCAIKHGRVCIFYVRVYMYIDIYACGYIYT